MEIFVLGLIMGIVGGLSHGVKKCEVNKAWCKATSAKIQPAPEQKSDGE